MIEPEVKLQLNASELMTLAAALTAFISDVKSLDHDDSRDMYQVHRRNLESLLNKFEDYAVAKGI